VRVKTPPPIFEKEEEINKWMMMHSSIGELLGAYDPNKNYPEGTTMSNHLQSVWGGEVTFRLNEENANGIGSTPDPLLPGVNSWIELWERQYGLENSCTSHNWASGSSTFVCNNIGRRNIIGGHVIVGRVASTTARGSNDVYIVPICTAHYANNAVYMRTNVYTQGIWLNNYLN